jgi:predicted amidohydrolase
VVTGAAEAAVRSVRVGLGQIRVEGGARAANLRRAADAIVCAAEAGCAVVVLPECLDLGWTDESARTDAMPVPGPVTDALGEVARRARIWVVAGVTERSREGVHNTAVLLDADGALALRHRKVNELDFARDMYASGLSVEVADTPFGRVGLPVCADNFPYAHFIAEAMARLGAGLLLSPSAWAVRAEEAARGEPYGAMWEASYRSLAVRHGVAVVAVSNVGPITGGPWRGRVCIGASLCTGPDGRVVARGPYGADAEALLVAEVPVRVRQGDATGIGVEG